MASQPQTTTPQGFTKANHLTAEQIEMICELIANGVSPVQACLEAGTTHTQLVRRCKRDQSVDEQVNNARLDGSPALLERVRHERDYHLFVKRDYKAVKDFLMVYDPDWEKMRTARFEIDHTVVGEIQHRLAQYTTEELEAIRKLELEKAEQHPVIEQQSSAA